MLLSYQIIAYVASTISFLLAFLLISKKKKTLSDYFLLSLMLTWGIVEITILLENNYNSFPALVLIADTSPVFIGQILYLYTRSLTQKQPSSSRYDAIHFLPALIYISFSAVLGIDYLNANSISYFLLRLPLKVLLSPVYIFLALRFLKQHRQAVKSYYSNTKKIDLAWLNILLIGILIIWAFFLITEMATWFASYVTHYQNFILNVSVSIFVVVIGFLGIRNASVFLVNTKPHYEKEQKIEKIKIPQNKEENSSSKDTKVPESETTKYEKNALSIEEKNLIQKKVVEVMEAQKPYLNPKLSIQDMAEVSSVSSHKLSQVLNTNLDVNFHDFVNRYRIKEFHKRTNLPQNKHLTLFAIAEQSGFASKSSFNRIHKNLTGKTPKQFLKEQKEQKFSN